MRLQKCCADLWATKWCEIEQVVSRLDAEDIEALMMNEGKFEYRLPDKADAKPGQRLSSWSLLYMETYRRW